MILSLMLALALHPAPAPARPTAPPEMLGNHRVVRAADGTLLPWTSWRDALDREMRWYLACPVEHGYPRCVWMTFMDGDYRPDPRREDFIPATQLGTGIVSYLAWDAFTAHRDPRVLARARAMGDYLVREASTPDSGAYPRFTRSTGRRGRFPQPPDCGTQGDRPYEIQPDKGGLAGDALVRLYRATGDRAYVEQALRDARALAANMRDGDATHSPWPFRADWRTGEARGDVSSDMVSVLRLFDGLLELGHAEFAAPRARLWTWIRDVQLADLDRDARLWVQFFEDHEGTENRNAWAPLNLARYLLERREALDPAWAAHAEALIEFVNRRFVTVRQGVAVCGEQDFDRQPWGGILSTYGAVLAMYGAATGSDRYRAVARQALDYALYAVDGDGCPCENALTRCRGGWQEDAHTDVVHNVVDAMRAEPDWGRARPRPPGRRAAPRR